MASLEVPIRVSLEVSEGQHRLERLMRSAAMARASVRVVPTVNDAGGIMFYAHVDGQDSDTIDGTLNKGQLVVISD